MEVQIGFDCGDLHLSSPLTRTDVQCVCARNARVRFPTNMCLKRSVIGPHQLMHFTFRLVHCHSIHMDVVASIWPETHCKRRVHRMHTFQNGNKNDRDLVRPNHDNVAYNLTFAFSKFSLNLLHVTISPQASWYLAQRAAYFNTVCRCYCAPFIRRLLLRAVGHSCFDY